MALVESSRDGAVAVVMMAHPERRNALSRDLVSELLVALQAAADDGCRALVLRAQPGARVWSAGHDVDDLPRDGQDPLAWTSPVEHLVRLVRALPFPVIAAVEGSVWGAACNLAVTCDLVVATREATFAITPAKLGVPYHTAGIAQFLSALPRNVVDEMFFTADPIDAERAHQLGLVNRLGDDGDAMERQAMEMAATIAERAPLSIRATKAEIAVLTDARGVTSEEFERLAALRRAAWNSRDYQEGLDAFHERRSPRFAGE